jgi:hypothetical protein
MEPLPRIKVILSIVVPVTIATILALMLAGCAQRALVRDCQDMKGTPFKNCEIVEKL